MNSQSKPTAAPPAVPPSAKGPGGLDFNLPGWPFWLLTGLVAVAFHSHFSWLVQKGWRNEYYGHGFLIPVVSGYLIWRRRAELTRLPREGFYYGLPLVIFGIAVHMLAVMRDVNFPQGFALVALISGLVIWLYGWPVGKALIFPLAFLLFAVPMGRLLVDTFAQPMQLMAARVAGVMAIFMGIPTEVDGTAIDIPDYRFEVAIPCSGLKSAIAMTALGALYAYVIVAPLWKRAIIFAMSLPAALVANSIRIWLTLVLARSFGPGAAEGFFHAASGILVFIIALLTLFGIGSLLQCTTIRDDV